MLGDFYLQRWKINLIRFPEYHYMTTGFAIYVPYPPSLLQHYSICRSPTLPVFPSFLPSKRESPPYFT